MHDNSKTTMKNYGFNLELEQAHQKPTDWRLGAAPVCVALIPEGRRTFYAPIGEVQRGAEDTMDCVTRGMHNIIEAKLNYLWKENKLPEAHRAFLKDNGYLVDGQIELSDAFNAINSGTTRYGNSLIAPLDAIRKNGVIPKERMPLLPEMTFDEYHDSARITPELRTLGLKFLELFNINYEKIDSDDFPVVLNMDMIVTGGFAWPNPVNGIYPRVESDPNHCFDLWQQPTYFVFDNYIDSVDGDYFKQLAPNYKLIDHGYRIIITLNGAEAPVEVKKNIVPTKKLSLIARFVAALKKLFNL